MAGRTVARPRNSGILRYGARSMTVSDLKKELKLGLLRAMCGQIGIDPDDLRKV
jgi:hypothetical protein